jgi:hypothetical protein
VLPFGLSVPTTTLQQILDLMGPTLTAYLARHSATLYKAIIQTDSSGTVTCTLTGLWSGFGFEVTLTLNEALGIKTRPGTSSNMPAVLSSSGSASPSVADSVADGYASKVDEFLTGVLDELPAWIPFRSSSIPDTKLQGEYPFPMAVLNFESFSTTDSGIAGNGMLGLQKRDQSIVRVLLTGIDSFPNYEYGDSENYSVSLTAFEPDNDKMSWKFSEAAGSTTFATDPFSQQGSFSTALPLPQHASGPYQFTLAVNATETCATDSTQTLNGSASLTIKAYVGVQR